MAGLALVTGGLALLGVVLFRQRGFGTPDEAAARPSVRWRLGVAAVAVLGVALRAAAMLRAGPDTYEYGPLLDGRQWYDALFGPVRDTALGFFHGPLQPLLAFGWGRALDALGVVPSLPLLRAPNLLLAVAQIALIAVLGRRLGAPRAGLAAAFLLAVLPFGVRVAVMQESYLLDAVLTAWILERLVAALTSDARLLGLAVAGGLLAWNGWLGGPVLVLSGLALLAASVRARRPGPPLAVLAFVALAFSVPLPNLLAGVSAFGGHPRGAAAAAPGVLAAALLAGTGLPGALLAGSAWVTLRRRPAWPAWLLALVAAYGGLAVALPLRDCNLALLVPLVLGLGLVGLERALTRARPGRVELALALLSLLLAHRAWVDVLARPEPPLSGVLFGGPFDGSVGHFRDARPLRRLLAETPPARAPLVVLDEPATVDALVQLPAPSTEALVQGARRLLQRRDTDPAVPVRDPAGPWDLLALPRLVERPPALPASAAVLDLLLGDPAVAGRPFVLVTSPRVLAAWSAPLDAALARAGIGCRERGGSPESDLVVHACAPLDSGR